MIDWGLFVLLLPLSGKNASAKYTFVVYCY